MKNIHIISTDKPSRLHYSKIQNSYGYILKQIPSTCNDGLLSGQRNIYITSDEEIKEGDWGVFLCDDESYEEIYQCKKANLVDKEDKKIILTTDSQLIQDGVQAIDDEFLEWFVKNPSCESVEVEKVEFEVDMGLGDSCIEYGNYYKIIIPKEEPKQETLEEAAKAFAKTQVVRGKNLTEWDDKVEEIIAINFTEGAKWQKEDMIEKIEMHILINEDDWNRNPQAQFRNFIEQFKKK
jgi:hypothetical protein